MELGMGWDRIGMRMKVGSGQEDGQHYYISLCELRDGHRMWLVWEGG